MWINNDLNNLYFYDYTTHLDNYEYDNLNNHPPAPNEYDNDKYDHINHNKPRKYSVG